YDPRVALFNADWSPKPNGLVWQDLILNQWRTNTSGQAGENGKYAVRGFLGDYLVNVTVGAVTKQVKVSMPTTAGASVTVVADGIASAPRSDTVNPIGDGDFETGTQGWTPLGGATSDVMSAISTDAHSGTRALAVGQGTGVSQNVYGLTAGTNYTLSGWAKLTAPGTQCYIGVRGGATANTPKFQYELSYADERSYTQKLLAFTPPSGTTWTQFFVWSNPNPTGATCQADDITLTPTTGTPPPAQAPPAITPKLPAASTLANGTLETQSSTTGWYCLGPCTLKNAANTPHSGSGDLSVTARGAAYAGPAQGVALSNGARYGSSAWVRLASPGSDTATVSLKVTSSTGVTTYRFGSATVSDTGWTRIGASDVKVSWSGTLQKAEWWVSTATSLGDLLVDDASFAPLAPVPTGTDLLGNGDAELGTDGSWYCFSPCVAQAATDPVHGGTTSIKATNRTYNYTGPAQGVAVGNGASYKTSAWVRMAAGASDTTAQIRLKLNKTDGTAVTIPMATAPVTAGGWTQLSANNVPVSWTGTLAKAEWFISTTAGADDFYVDDAALQPAGVETTAFNPVQPAAACVVRNSYDGTYTAYFGYSNANDFSVPVVVGDSNAFNPVPADRGQTQLFLPSQQSKRVAVNWDGKSDLTWQLNGYTETALKTSPSC
ncbi:MAG: hypothetical protein QOE61_6581, partial [Micromonosporaceae bacterium]|nr:hypothetical protein [Micromonosporaceae bacterium]